MSRKKEKGLGRGVVTGGEILPSVSSECMLPPSLVAPARLAEIGAGVDEGANMLQMALKELVTKHPGAWCMVRSVCGVWCVARDRGLWLRPTDHTGPPHRPTDRPSNQPRRLTDRLT